MVQVAQKSILGGLYPAVKCKIHVPIGRGVEHLMLHQLVVAIATAAGACDPTECITAIAPVAPPACTDIR